jgi:hypothetical protein
MQGSAQLYFGGKTVGAPIAASANGNLVFPPLTISSEVRTGGNTVQISYLGVPGRYAPVQSAVTTVPLNLIPARIQVSARPNPAAVGQPVTFVATITPPPGTPTCPSLQPGCTVGWIDAITDKIYQQGPVSADWTAQFTHAWTTRGSYQVVAFFASERGTFQPISTVAVEVVGSAGSPQPCADTGTIIKTMTAETKSLNLPAPVTERLVLLLNQARKAYASAKPQLGKERLDDYWSRLKPFSHKVSQEILSTLQDQIGILESCKGSATSASRPAGLRKGEATKQAALQ